MKTTRSRLMLGTALAGVALTMSACGGDDPSEGGDGDASSTSTSADNAEPSNAEEPEAAGNPYDCDTVWVVGETLPDDYDGSCTANDSINASGVVDCVDGSQYSTYDDRYFATLGGEVMVGPNGEDGADDEAAQTAYDEFARACLG